MNVSVIGAGLIGRRRANVASEYGDNIVSVYDTNTASSQDLAKSVEARSAASLKEAVDAADIVIVCTPNKHILPSARTAMESGKHTLIEKPMGRNLAEACQLMDLHNNNPGITLKTGFNHRYHPAISAAHKAVESGKIGDISFLRAIYGHGGRPGYEKEWRGDKDLAGGGELTDQGVHVIDLLCWFASQPNWAFAQKRTCTWPLENMEDNGFFMLGWNDGKIAQCHTSWTQWKNRFSLEVFGTAGAAIIEGLGGSYGEEKLILLERNPKGGIPATSEQTFPDENTSWELEWKDFRNTIDKGSPLTGGTPDQGLAVMKTLNAIYESCDTSTKTEIS